MAGPTDPIDAPLIVGAGPAGTAAAITLAAAGVAATIWDKAAVTGDAICGGFLSWRTCAALEQLGIDPAALGGHPVTHLRLFAARTFAETRLPAAGLGLSRRSLDTALLDRAVALGTTLERGRKLTEVADDGTVRCEPGEPIRPAALFVATGKHNLRGLSRQPPRGSTDPALGLRVRLGPAPALARLVGPAIELHLFDRGYAGLVLQEDGGANLCLAVRKSRLGEAGGDPATLLDQLAHDAPALAERLAFRATQTPFDAIAAVPYGWRAEVTVPGRFLLGDQAACIPSLAGEGIGIAIASGTAAARAWLAGGGAAAPRFQHDFAATARRPVDTAMALWRLAERPAVARWGIRAIGLAPPLADFAARLTRIEHRD